MKNTIPQGVSFMDQFPTSDDFIAWLDTGIDANGKSTTIDIECFLATYADDPDIKNMQMLSSCLIVNIPFNRDEKHA